jgi:hypothetical protein
MEASNLSKLMASLSIKGGIKKKPTENKTPPYLLHISQTKCKSDIPLAILVKMRKCNVTAVYRE